MIPYGRQQITPADIEAVTAVLRSDFLTQGPMVPRFESAVASRAGAPHAVAVNSATSALHVACEALELGPGDELWTTPNTFVASANCGRYCGATIDFVDIDPVTWNMDVDRLEFRLREAQRSGRLPKIVVPVHFGGQPTNQEAIWALAQEFGFHVVEDASHAIGASRHGEPVGSCRWSDVTVFSFHPVKIITTTEGGMALTRSSELAARMALLRTHGVTRDPSRFVGGPAGSWHYEQLALGWNYRMTDIQAALGISQLQRLDGFVARRNQLAARYGEFLKNFPLRLPTVCPDNVSAFHLYVVRVADDEEPDLHRRVIEGMRSLDIGVNVHYMPVHLQPYYRGLGFKAGDFPEAEAHGRKAITLPLYPDLTEGEQDRVIKSLGKLLGV